MDHKKAENNGAVNRTEVLHYCQEVLHEAVTEGWVDSFLLRHQDKLFETKSLPQENPRLQVPRQFLDDTINNLKAIVHGACAEMVFNLDEVGISEWEDRVPRKVIAPVSMKGQAIHHGIHRGLKHVSVVACISAAGESMTPYFVSSQVTPKLERLLKLKGFRFGVDLILRQRNKPYMNRELFQEYISDVLIPYIEELRTNEEFAHEEAVLLMDNCTVHTSDDVLKLLADHHVKVVTFPPHTTQIFQSLDLSLFGVLKRKRQYRLPLDSDESTDDFIRRIFHGLKQTLVEDNVRGAFMMIGLQYDIDVIPYRLIFDERKLRESPAFIELWTKDYPFQSLSKRRQNAAFGWINQHWYPTGNH